MSISFDFELNPIGLRGPFLEYRKANRPTVIDSPWPNTGSAPSALWDLTGGHLNGDGITKHFWKSEVYTDEDYATISGGSTEISMPTYGEMWNELGGKGSTDHMTYAFRIGDLDNVDAVAQYIQCMVEISNAEYDSGVTTIASSIKRFWLGYAVRNQVNSRVLQQNGQAQSPDGGGWDTTYIPGAGDTDWANSIFVVTGQIGKPGSTKAWKNGVQIGPPWTDGSSSDWPVDWTEGGTTWVEEFDATWGNPDPYPNRFTAQGSNSPENATVDAIFTLMEGHHTSGSSTNPDTSDNGITDMAFYRGEPTLADITGITNLWT